LADTLRRYDHRLGRFSSYAFPRLRNELAALAATRMGQLGLPVYLSKLRRQALGYAGGGGGPTTAIADEFPADKAKLWRKAASFSPPAALAEDSLEAPPADTGLEEADLVDRALRKLPGSYREVLSARYLDNPPRTYEELGRSLGLSPSSVRRMEARGLDSLRALLRSWDAA
jgi:RNA polymerase sigma factor (sigma-70 family)